MNAGRPLRDLIIVGGGPAGAAAAIEARQAGADVAVIDRATFPRDKCCGDGLTAAALRNLEELGVDPRHLPSFKAVDEVHLVDAKGRNRVFPLPTNRGSFAAVVRRRELDNLLLARAADSGAECREQTTLVALTSEADRVVATVEHPGSGREQLEGRYLIAADGMWSPTRKMLGVAASSYRGTWHAFRQYFSGVSLKAQSDLIVWFEPDLLPGYVWSFPLGDGSANVGFGILRGGRRVQDMGKLWPEVLDRPHIREVLGPEAEAEGRHTAWPIPADLGRLPLTAGRVLFAGDAAAATDPLTGEGIGQAMETGRLAARTITTEHNRPELVAQSYEATLQRGMVRDHSLAGWLSQGLSTERGANLSLAVAGMTPWTRRNFARWLFEDYPRATLGTPHRWSRQVFSSPGAFADQGN